MKKRHSYQYRFCGLTLIYTDAVPCASVTPPILIDKKTAARLLGISEGMIAKLVRRRELEPVRIGRKVLFRREDIELFALPPSKRKAMAKACGSVQ